ncbi:O-antigen ligase family protein [Clostridium weizhouense]|uniref:O-antigen ligase family protein n=1 Tax=Clostridium weizhouense TaxID=2859781 RepID=A0ABS7AQI3_9CLOT|nr:O-antigen ligase family protein [Clostridium weizhouense]MBW6410894.1 O-antigen ligase family protein [Clostridium weizhouense]
MREVLGKIYEVIDNRLYFRLLYLFVSMSFVTILSCIPGIKLLNTLALAWGMLLILFMIFNDYKRRKIYKFDIPLAGFIIITLIFNLTVYRDSENIKKWLFNIILLMSIYTIDVFKDKKINIKEMNIITYFYTIIMFILSLGSLFMRFSGKTIKVGEILFGYTNEYTNGLFINENALSIAAALAIVMSIYLNSKSKSGKIKIFYVVNIIVQIISMIEARGRSAYLVVIAIGYLFLFVYCKNKYFRTALIIIPLLLGSIGFTFNETKLHKITTGRNILWKSASLVIKEHPLTGVGYSDLIESVRNVREVEYLPGIEGGRLHNIYIEIATVNGVISLVLIFIFLIGIITFIIKKLDKLKRKEKFQMTTITSMIVGIVAVNVFESNLVYIVSFISIIFWIYLGYLVSILDNKNIS